MKLLWVSPFVLQGAAMLVDEFHFHRKRGLGAWERLGHPLDTISVLACLGFALLANPDDDKARTTFLILSLMSCLLITKDEWIHARESPTGEQWLHAGLFILHPVILGSTYLFWQNITFPGHRAFLVGQAGITALFLLYQLISGRVWDLTSEHPQNQLKPAPRIQNEIYDRLGDRWYTAKDDPVALLRAETRARLPWIIDKLANIQSAGPLTLLDLGCGAGLLSNSLRKHLDEGQFTILGVDSSRESLEIAKKHHPRESQANSVQYHLADARKLPFSDHSLDAVLAMDFLEHVEQPQEIIREISRVLKPGGLFLFHTFTRTPLSRLLVIDLVETFVPNTPPNLHVDSLFIRPEELSTLARRHSLETQEFHALNPVITIRALANLIFRREIPDHFRFRIEPIRKLSSGYIGTAVKIGNPR